MKPSPLWTAHSDRKSKTQNGNRNDDPLQKVSLHAGSRVAGLYWDRRMSKRITVLILLAMGSLVAFARNDTVESFYDRFIERFADENPAWKTEITLRADVSKPPAPPYKLHYNDSLGYYTYRPKHWAELNDYERFALTNDPRRPHFIREHALTLRGELASASAKTPRVADTEEDSQTNGLLRREGQNTWGYHFEPEDLLNTKPLRLVELPQ